MVSRPTVSRGALSWMISIVFIFCPPRLRVYALYQIYLRIPVTHTAHQECLKWVDMSLSLRVEAVVRAGTQRAAQSSGRF